MISPWDRAYRQLAQYILNHGGDYGEGTRALMTWLEENRNKVA